MGGPLLRIEEQHVVLDFLRRQKCDKQIKIQIVDLHIG